METEAWDDETDRDPRSHVVLVLGELETGLFIADGPEAVERVVRDAAPLTRDGAPIHRPATNNHSPDSVGAASLVAVDDASGAPEHAMRAWLLISSSSPNGEGDATSANALAGLTFNLSRSPMTIGRSDENDIIIRHHSVSRNHARVTCDASTGRYVIQNLDATNGVRVNGEAHETIELHDGDWVDFGHVRMSFVNPSEVQASLPDVGAVQERFLIVGRDPVVLDGERIRVGELLFRIEEVREYALRGANIPLRGGKLLQAALAMFVVAAAEREGTGIVQVEEFWTARSGSGDGPPVIWLHGGPGLWDYLEPASALTDTLCISYRYDQRWCGRTRARGGLTVAQSVADLEALRAHWGVDRFILAGHGWGASLAVHYTLEHAEHVAGRVLIGACGLVPGSRDAALEELHRRVGPEGRARIEALGERLEADNALEDERAFFETVWAPDFVDPASARTLFVADLRINGSVHSSLDDADRHRTEAPGFLDRLREQDVPTLIVHGERDTRPASAARELAALLPGADLLLVPLAGHCPWVEAPEILRAGLQGFIRRARSS